jgi:hypothetical protein
MIARRGGVHALTLVLLLIWSGTALAQGAKIATIYELTENMKLIAKGKGERRAATSQLMGFADVGTPLCPAELVEQLGGVGLLPSGTRKCTINMTGSDDIDIATGQGPFRGKFTVVVQGDNPVDGPELVVGKGRFSGEMDFAPALRWKLPYGTVRGRLVAYDQASVPFTGTFRLPFLGSYAGPETGGMTLRQIFCPLTPAPNPNLFGPDIVYLDTTAGAPNGKCIDVLPNELSLGIPTVRFDAEFQ